MPAHPRGCTGRLVRPRPRAPRRDDTAGTDLEVAGGERFGGGHESKDKPGATPRKPLSVGDFLRFAAKSTQARACPRTGAMNFLRPAAREVVPPGGMVSVSPPPFEVAAWENVYHHLGVEYYAHTYATADRTDWRGLSRHLYDTGARSAAFLEHFGCAELGRIAGLLHDLGKYSREFQARLSGEAGPIDHSTAGAKVALDRYGPKLGQLLAFCIAGHHAGLANGVNGGETSALADWLTAKIPEVDPVWESQIDLPERTLPALKPRDAEAAGFSVAVMTRGRCRARTGSRCRGWSGTPSGRGR